MHIQSLLKKMGIKAVVTQPNHRVVGWLWCPHLIPCQVGVVNVMWYPCGRSWMCMARMNLWDLSHTCACTWWCIQRDGGNEIVALPVLRTREPYNLLKLNFTLTMRLTLVILGPPPGRTLFNVKSRTLRAFTMVSCWWRLNVVAMAIPLFFLYI